MEQGLKIFLRRILTFLGLILINILFYYFGKESAHISYFFIALVLLNPVVIIGVTIYDLLVTLFSRKYLSPLILDSVILVVYLIAMYKW